MSFIEFCKYFGIICFMILIILSCGCISNFFSTGNDVDNNKTSDGTYSVAGVNFKYPDKWNVNAEKQSENFIKISAAPTYEDSKSSSSTPYIIPLNIAQFVVAITSNYNLTQENESMQIDYSNYNKISNDTLIIDGIKSYRQIFTVNCNGTVLRCEQINFVKNNKAYIMTFQAVANEFDKEKPNFDIILNSFKVD